MTGASHPGFRTLAPDECTAILARNHVGRIAYARDGRVEIQPLNYVYHDGWLYGRTSAGAGAASAEAAWAPVAFEVDEVEEFFRWRSVVVHGGFHVLADDGREHHDQEWWQGIQLLRTLIPETYTSTDPVRFRRVVFRMAVQEVTGREAVPGHAPAGADTRSARPPGGAEPQARRSA